jgi:hypothetical protein
MTTLAEVLRFVKTCTTEECLQVFSAVQMRASQRRRFIDVDLRSTDVVLTKAKLRDAVDELRSQTDLVKIPMEKKEDKIGKMVETIPTDDEAKRWWDDQMGALAKQKQIYDAAVADKLFDQLPKDVFVASHSGTICRLALNLNDLTCTNVHPCYIPRGFADITIPSFQ